MARRDKTDRKNGWYPLVKKIQSKMEREEPKEQVEEIAREKCSSVVGGFCLLEHKICPGWCKTSAKLNNKRQPFVR